MPEMPEVETIRRDLAKHILRKRIASVAVLKKHLVKNPAPAFIKTLRGNRIERLARRGKLLIAHLASGGFLLIHLKMTGQLIYQDKKILAAGGHGEFSRDERLPNKYSYIIFSFSGGSKLFFNDQRQFGYMKVVDEPTLARILSEYGIEPLSRDFTLAKFRGLIKGRAAPIKAILLNQKLIAGIGNIYADEICFAAAVLPNRRGNKIKPDEIKKLWRSCRAVLKRALKMRGTTFKDFRDGRGQKGNFADYLKVYGRAGKPCRRCRTELTRVRSAGRGTVYCPNCQR